VGGQTRLSSQVASHVVSELGSRLQRERAVDDHRLGWDRRIDQVLAGGDGMRVVFQPIVALETGAFVGFEALARFTDEPVQGPDVWFAEAAALGRALELELAAVRAAVACVDDLPTDAFVSLNVSPESIMSSEFVGAVDGIPFSRVVVEVTEHAPVNDYPRMRSALQDLRERGARLAVDDAGAGYASLRHILQLEPDFIKLDVTLTRGIEAQRSQRALASALVTFGREVDAAIIAEGIETEDELAVIRELGVPLGQGYYLGRPAPPQDFTVEEPGLREPVARRA
jgi:EAL domain-containing protein (putative c-di-GMP-specific phosphodiesterase class I)